LELFMSIIRRGITIVTLQDEQIYSTESIKDNWTKLIIALAVMARAHEESLTKSMRVKEAWNKKREAGEVLTKICPAWLKHDGKWVINEQKAEVVRRIFKMAHDGNGTPTIARVLNEDKTPTMGWAKEWTFGTVAAILKNEAVIGTLVSKKTTADPVESYYPAIVKKELFYEVQARINSRKWIGGRSTENVRNLFSGYCYCGLCGSKMRAIGSNDQHTYMRCLSAYSVFVVRAAREKLPTWRIGPSGHHALIRLVERVLEVQQGDHDAQRYAGTPGVAGHRHTLHLLPEQVKVGHGHASAALAREHLGHPRFDLLPGHA
jgi:hypothetical protein